MTTLDKYQQPVVDFMATAEDSLHVDALAGSGKSTVILAGAERRASFGHVFAFNASIASEMKAKLEKRNLDHLITCSTFNAAGWRVLLKKYGRKLEVNKFKSWDLMREAGFNFSDKMLAKLVVRVVGLAKASNLHPTNGEGFHELLTHLGITLPSDEQGRILEAARAVFQLSWIAATNDQIFDFDDQLYVPVQANLSLPNYNFICVDEAQDVSPIQIEFLARTLTARGRLIAVGDTRQAIYAFRGASTAAISILGQRFKTDSLPLNICYRCPKSVIVEAQKLVPQLEWAPGSELGVVDTPPAVSLGSFQTTDRIICRNNAPLFSLACRFLSRRIPFQYDGDQFNDVLAYYIGKVGDHCNIDFLQNDGPIDKFLDAADEMFNAEIERWEARGVIGQVDALEEYKNVFHILGAQEHIHTVQNMMQLMQVIFRGKSGPMLSTIHKSKGTEAPRVFLLEPHLVPSPKANTPEMIQQENNLLYIAITRAQREFFYLPAQNIV